MTWLRVWLWRIARVFYMAPWVPYRTTRVRCLVMQGDQLLLTQEAVGDGLWGLPGGGKRRQESPEQAARRELNEELSINREDVMSVRVGRSVKVERGLNRKTFIFIAVRIRPETVVEPNFEISDWQLITLDHIDWGITHPIVKEGLRAVNFKT